MEFKIVVEDSGSPTTDGEYTCIKTWILEDRMKELKRVKELIHEVLPNLRTIQAVRAAEIEMELRELEIPF